MFVYKPVLLWYNRCMSHEKDHLYTICRQAVGKYVRYVGTNGDERSEDYGKAVSGVGLCESYHDSHGLCLKIMPYLTGKARYSMSIYVDPVFVEISPSTYKLKETLPILAQDHMHFFACDVIENDEGKAIVVFTDYERGGRSITNSAEYVIDSFLQQRPKYLQYFLDRKIDFIERYAARSETLDRIVLEKTYAVQIQRWERVSDAEASEITRAISPALISF